MFSGIIESVEPVLAAVPMNGAIRIVIKKPHHFDDLKIGDSIACNGVCLTVESFNETSFGLAIAAETIRVLFGPQHLQEGADLSVVARQLLGLNINLERSLRFGDRIHGHLVSGHVDSLAEVIRKKNLGESVEFFFKMDPRTKPFVWAKGSVTLNGVSLTLNSVNGDEVSVCLIPETLKRTNLGSLEIGQTVTCEPDYFAKAVFHFQQLKDQKNAIEAKL
jgi:riboflavin synthase